jgi:hypothetical protein
MFQLYVMQNQWLMLALIGGTALLLVFLLGYPALWRPREPMAEKTPEKQSLLAFMPWILVVLYGVTIVYAVVYVIRMAGHPPNW